MRIIDPTILNRIKKPPVFSADIMIGSTFSQDHVLIKSIHLRQYIEKYDEKLGPYSLLTSFVDTDIGSIELLYDEGYRGDNALNEAVQFLKQNLGLSALILRSIIALNNRDEKNLPS